MWIISYASNVWRYTMKANYHTHTKRCHHAIGEDEEYVLSAIEGGFNELGFSDHTPWDYHSDFVAHMRMKLERFEEYRSSILYLKEKYKGQINIKLGLEVEYFEEYMPWLKSFLKEKELDYIIFGNHYYKSDESRVYFGTACARSEYLEIYAEECVNGMKTGMYSYLCHPELFMRGYPRFDENCERISRKICEGAKAYNVPLEYNLAGLKYNLINGVEQYPHKKFWEIAKAIGNTAIIGVDAHNNKDLSDTTYWDYAQAYLNGLGIKVIDHIETKGFK